MRKNSLKAKQDGNILGLYYGEDDVVIFERNKDGGLTVSAGPLRFGAIFLDSDHHQILKEFLT